MGDRVRSLDWALTPLGPPETWPQSLRSAVSICLGSAFPIALYWGGELTLLYNDAWSPIPGAKHPRVLGQPAMEAWPEIWSMIGPLFVQVMSSGEAVYSEDQLLPMERHGYREECYFNFTFSPVRGESGGVDGVFNAVLETTYRVIAERRETALRELAERLGPVHRADEVCATAVEVLCRNPHDAPFAAIYRLGEGSQAERVAHCPGHLSESLAPLTLAVDGEEWPISEALASRAPVVAALHEAAVLEPWPEEITSALVTALESPGAEDRFVLVMGTSPRRAIDDDYRNFGVRVGSQISRALANASAYELQRERARALAELDAAKTSFFSNVSHEFRTPLTLILGPLEAFLDAPGSTLTLEREELSVVRRNARRLQRLVDTLLDFSRLEAGKVEPTIEAVDLTQLTRELAGMFQSTLETAGVGLTIDCARLPRDAHVDREMWEKIVLNLLSNAFKFTLEGEIGVSLRADGDVAVLEVRDTGSGIPEEELPKLFQRFHRVPRSRGRSHEGSGIGLALVRDLVALHGGEVGVESELGKGSAFTVRVPLGAPVEDVLTRSAAPVAARARPYVEEAMRWLPQTDVVTAQPPASSARILVVDDNPDMREYIGRLLGSYRVEFATTGAEGLAAVEASRPDLVVTDVMMPDVDGMSLVGALRGDARFSALPILMVSGRAGEDARLEGIERGADEYLVKPFSARELIARVSALLALASARSEAESTLRESELRFRNMADHAPVMIWVTEADGSCSFLNHTWYQFTGQTPDTGLGFGWLEAVHPDDRDAAAATFIEANENHIGFRLEYRLRRFDGEYQWAIDAAAPRFEDGRFLGYVGSVIDISELRAVTEALRESDRMKDEFLATLAHEIRNPLAAIRHGVEVMKSADESPLGRRIGAIVERQIAHLVRLVDDLLDVSRISRGKIQLERAPLDLRGAVRTAIETARPLIEEHGHALTIQLPDDSVVVLGDRVRLEQVFANLLTNAAHYTPPGGNIDIALAQVDDTVEVSVSDDGIGLSGDEATAIFELFKQVSSPDRRRSGGLGVGLSLVRRLVGMHGGAVHAQSEGRMKGSRISVTLPLLRQSAPTAEQQRTRAESHFVVVLADDNEDAVELFAMLLTSLGHEVHVGTNGAEAVALVRTHRPDIVLLDIGMPVMDGFEACREIRELPGGDRMLVVAQTGWGQREDRRRSAEAGFDQHLVKPVSRELLEELFESAPALLARRRAES